MYPNLSKEDKSDSLIFKTLHFKSSKYENFCVHIQVAPVKFCGSFEGQNLFMFLLPLQRLSKIEHLRSPYKVGGVKWSPLVLLRNAPQTFPLHFMPAKSFIREA